MEEAHLVEEYKQKLESAEALITEYDTKLQAAKELLAEKNLKINTDYNNTLVETINDLENKNRQLENDYTADLEELRQQNYALQKKLDVQVSLERSMVSEVESMREKLNHEEIKVARVEDLQMQKAVLEAKLEENAQQMTDLELEVADLQRKVNEGSRPVPREQSVHEVSGYLDHITSLAQENSDLNEKAKEDKLKLGALEEDLNNCQRQVKLLESSVEESRMSAELYKQQSTEYREHLQASKEEIVELRAELEGLKATTGGGFFEKGNSLFSEVDDERKKLHDHIMKQKESYQAMKLKYQSMADNLAHYKLKLASALSLNATTQGEKKHVQQLKDSLSKSVQQVKSLTERLDEVEKESSEKDVKQGIDSIVAAWRTEKLQLEKSLRSSKLNYLMLSDEKLQIEHKLKQSEEVCKQLRGDIITLNVKLEEKKKQTDEESNGTAAKKPITEQIPSTPKEEFVLRERCSRPERMKMETTETKDNVPVKRGSDSDDVFSDNYGFPLKLKSKQKKVAISETVELQYECGRRESGSMSEEEKKPLNRLGKGRKVDLSEKEIPNEVPDECKQQ